METGMDERERGRHEFALEPSPEVAEEVRLHSVPQENSMSARDLAAERLKQAEAMRVHRLAEAREQTGPERGRKDEAA
jgi:hypothetical protein